MATRVYQNRVRSSLHLLHINVCWHLLCFHFPSLFVFALDPTSKQKKKITKKKSVLRVFISCI